MKGWGRGKKKEKKEAADVDEVEKGDWGDDSGGLALSGLSAVSIQFGLNIYV